MATIGFGMIRIVNTEDTHAGQESKRDHPFGFHSINFAIHYGSSTLVRFNGCMSFIQSITCSLKLFCVVGNEDGAHFTTCTCVYINIFNDNHANKHYNYIFCLAILNMVIVFSRTVTSTLQ